MKISFGSLSFAALTFIYLTFLLSFMLVLSFEKQASFTKKEIKVKKKLVHSQQENHLLQKRIMQLEYENRQFLTNSKVVKPVVTNENRLMSF